MVENNGHDAKQMIEDLHKMMFTVANSGPDGAASVTLRSKHMLIFVNIARKNTGEEVTDNGNLQHDRLSSPDYAMGFADKIKEQLLYMVNKENTNLPAEAISIADTLTKGFKPIYEHIVGERGPLA